jgi:hypothetical protein|tara:strand:- start:601 stop:777 length:177 start_codon:yes stop_codon:yes gene_type:complete
MKDKTFGVSFSVVVEADNNILGSYDEDHINDVHDLIVDIIYDIDDIKSINNLIVKEKE